MTIFIQENKELSSSPSPQLIYALAYFTKLKPTINPVKCHYIKAEEITLFHQRNQMISENA